MASLRSNVGEGYDPSVGSTALDDNPDSVFIVVTRQPDETGQKIEMLSKRPDEGHYVTSLGGFVVECITGTQQAILSKIWGSKNPEQTIHTLLRECSALVTDITSFGIAGNN